MTSSRKKRPPATTPEAQERRMIGLAIDLAERQLEEGTASVQVQIHYLKLASEREKLERQKLENENELLRMKTESLASNARSEEMYEQALEAMKKYSGSQPQKKIELVGSPGGVISFPGTGNI